MEFKIKNRCHIVNGLLVLLCTGITSNNAVAADKQFGKTILARGNVTADRNSSRERLKRLSPLFQQDILRSGNNARGQFRMIDNALINLQQNSVLRLEEYELKSAEGDGSVVMELLSGGLRTITGAVGKKDKKDYQLKTPVATIGIRGTLYEVEIVPNGMYAAAWQGNISVKSYSGRCNLELGDDFKQRFVFINSQGVCRILATVPRVFGEGHSSSAMATPDSNRTVASLEGNFQSTLPFQGLAVGRIANALERGRTSSYDNATPNIQLNDGVVSSTGSSADFSQTIDGYNVTLGHWNAYNLESDLDGLEGRPVSSDGMLWAAYKASDTESISGRVGQVRYDNMLGSLSRSTLGEVDKLAVQMDINFAGGIGAISNGAISAQVPEHTWVGTFGGDISNEGKLNIGFNGGALVNANTGVYTSTSGGDIVGDFVGENAEAVVGAYNMLSGDSQIEGVFLVGQSIETQ